MAKKLFVEANTEAGLNAAETAGTLNAEIAFIKEQGNEGIHAKGKTYQTIPSGGEEGQILMCKNGKGAWYDLDVIDNLSYGVEWDSGVADPVITRVGNMYYHKTLPIQSGMKGCIYNPVDKKVVYWLDDNDWHYRKNPLIEDITINAEQPILTDTSVITSLAVGQYVRLGGKIKGVITAIEEDTIHVEWIGKKDPNLHTYTKMEIGSRLDGYDGEVMIHVPGFYIRSWDGDKKSVRVSPVKIDDTWEYQPELFMSAYRATLLNTVPENMGYLSTLEVNAAVSIANNATYCRGGNNHTSGDASEDIFRSNLGKCRTNITRPDFRLYARKTGQEIMSYRQYRNILYWLWVIEYASFNCQAEFNPEITAEGFHQGGMGPGCTTMNSWNVYNGNLPIVPNGYTNELGNGTGVKDLTIPAFTTTTGVEIASQTLKSVRWRGIEDPFGHLNVYVDGIYINASENNPDNLDIMYTTDDPSKYENEDSNVMEFAGYKTHQEGYIKEWNLGTTAEIFPGLMEGDATLGKCDYHTPGSRNGHIRLPILGGDASSGSKGGLGCMITDVQTDYNGFVTGARLTSVV